MIYEYFYYVLRLRVLLYGEIKCFKSPVRIRICYPIPFICSISDFMVTQVLVEAFITSLAHAVNIILDLFTLPPPPPLSLLGNGVPSLTLAISDT